MKEMSMAEIESVAGGGVAEWRASVGAATAFLGIGLGVANPIGAGILLGASIISSGLAMYSYP